MASTQETTQINDTIITNGTGIVSLLTQAQVSLAPNCDASFSPEDTEIPEKGFQDSGFYEDNGNLPNSSGNGDFTLFDEDDAYLTDNDMLDIASVKANHGSIYGGTNNRSTAQIPRGTSYDDLADERTAFYDPIRDASQISGNDEEEPQPQHTYSTLEPNPSGHTSLQTWASIPERHEFNACRFHQLPHPTQVIQTTWLHEEDIDLEDIRQPYY